MASETSWFREMGYSEGMGMDKRGSISGVMTTKAPSTDVDRDAKSLTSYGVHGRSKDGKSRHKKRSGKRK